MALRRTTEPASEPITTTEAKAHLRVASATDDVYIAATIKAVRQVAENILGRSLMLQGWTKTLDYFPDQIELPYPPITGVTNIDYYDTDGTLVTLSPTTYTLDSASEPGWIVPAYSYAWPDTLDAVNAVTVTYTAGYADAASVPEAIKQWMLVQIGNLYENREATVPGVTITPLPFIDGLLDPYRVLRAA